MRICTQGRDCHHSETISFNASGHFLGNRLGERIPGSQKYKLPSNGARLLHLRALGDPWILSAGQQGVIPLTFCFQVNISGMLHFGDLRRFQTLLKGQGVWAEGIPVNQTKRFDLRGQKQSLIASGDDVRVLGLGVVVSLVAFTLVVAVPYLFLIFVQAVARAINIKEWGGTTVCQT